LHAIKSKALDVDCLRGFAKLSDIARISRADEYDEITHPDGIQRELNITHAREAYGYAAAQKPGEKRIWPEVILGLRDKKGVKIESVGQWKGQKEICPVTIKVDLGEIKLNKIDPTFSRVDGNHRLYYADGSAKKFQALDVMIPFCIIENITRNEEVLIFKTINEKQSKLRTDHLLRIDGQIMKGFELMKKDPILWIVTELNMNNVSPFFKLIHIAGRKAKEASYIISQKSLYDGIRLLYRSLDVTLKQTQNLKSLAEIIVRYFNAVAKKWPTAWRDSSKYLLMSNTGLQALGIVGAKLIERMVLTKTLKEDDFLNELNAIQFSWEKIRSDGTRLPTGRSGGEIIANEMLKSMTSTEVDLNKLL